MANRNSLSIRADQNDPPEVDEAERKVGGVLEDVEDLEVDTESEVNDVDLEEVVDTDDQGRPVVEESVDKQVEHRPRKGWAR